MGLPGVIPEAFIIPKTTFSVLSTLCYLSSKVLKCSLKGHLYCFIAVTHLVLNCSHPLPLERFSLLCILLPLIRIKKQKKNLINPADINSEIAPLINS